MALPVNIENHIHGILSNGSVWNLKGIGIRNPLFVPCVPLPMIYNAELLRSKRNIVARAHRNRSIGDFLKELHIRKGYHNFFDKMFQQTQIKKAEIF